jgi:enoyl-CoA hydratase/carnithine racemase
VPPGLQPVRHTEVMNQHADGSDLQKQSEQRWGSVTLSESDGVAVLRLGDGLNTVDGSVLDAVFAVLDRVEAAEVPPALVTVGSQRAYCTGYDLEFLAGLEQQAMEFEVERSLDVLARVLTYPGPTVAAISGHAFGYGAMLAMAHDQRVMRADRGWFCLPEVDLGLEFQPFQLALVRARMTPQAAHRAITTGHRFGAAEALAAGIVEEVAEPDETERRACELVGEGAGKAPAVVKALKTALYAEVLAAPRLGR